MPRSVLTIGPMIELQAEAKALLDLKIDSNVHLAYKVDNRKGLFSCNRFII